MCRNGSSKRLAAARREWAARTARAVSVVLIVIVSVGGAAYSSPLAAQDSLAAETVAPWLAEPILRDQQPQAEVERFCAERVLRLTPPASREQWQTDARVLRQRMLDEVVYRGQAAQWRDAECAVVWLDTIDSGQGYRIRKLRYEALPGLWIPALLYEPAELADKAPVMLNVNGHDGNGKAAKYKQLRCINQAKRGMLSLNVEWLNMGQLRSPGFGHYLMNQLDLCGTSGVAPFYLAMKRGLDVLLSHPHADPQRVAVAGLSGGGWQTIFISSLDERVTLSNPVAGYSSYLTRIEHHADMGDSEQMPSDMAAIADYTHLTALLAPRPALLTYNVRDDCCFTSGYALQPLLDAAEPFYRLWDAAESLRWHVNHDPGTHNFEIDNRQALYRMLGDHFFADRGDYPDAEIPSDDEVKTADELTVPLPAENADFSRLAAMLAANLPRGPQLPLEAAGQQAWARSRVDQLRRLTKIADYSLAAVETGRAAGQGIEVIRWQVRLGELWTVPVVELVPAAPKQAVILVGDNGRRERAADVAALLKDGHRVFAVDPLLVGESKLASRGALFALMIAAVGERACGIQAGQMAAVARWIDRERGLGPVRLVAHGSRLSLSALLATVVEAASISSATLHQSLGSLKEVIERQEGVDAKPEVFCFGLLEQFDVAGMVALAAPRKVRFAGPSDRVRQELAGLPALYEQLGHPFDPRQ